MAEIYLDNSATTQVDHQVAEYTLGIMVRDYGNPSSLHRKGFQAQLRLEEARARVAQVLGVTEDWVVFTGSGSEGNNMAILGVAEVYRRKGGRMVVSAAEHSSVLEPMGMLERAGWEIVRVTPLPSGHPDVEGLAAAVDEQTRLVTVGAVNSETGALADLETLCRAVKARNEKTLVHVDGVQGFCRIPLRPKSMGIDLLTVSGHKINAPKGVGALIIRKGLRLVPVLYGGGQERGLRPGTENVPSCCAMGLAAQLLFADRRRLWDHWTGLREEFFSQVEKVEGLCINSPPDSAPYIMNLSVPGVRSETMIHFLEDQDIYISSGSACSRGAKSHVLTAMGLSSARIDSALRLSMGKFTTREDILAAAAAIAQGARTLARP